MRFFASTSILFVASLCLGAALAVVSCAQSGNGDPPVDTTHDASLPVDSGQSCPNYDLTKDPFHCGSCTKACSIGEICDNGTCKRECDPPRVKCQGQQGCFDLTNDVAHCGACDRICQAPEGGAPPPDAGTSEAGTSDAGDAGDAGAIVDPGVRVATATCEQSKCSFSCPNGSSKCGTTGCYDLTLNHENCGQCGRTCAFNEVCTSSTCCLAGQAVCNGQCTNVQTDLQNCGQCGRACTATGQSCQGGNCVCPTGQTVCNNVCTNTTTDTQNCGQCGRVCPTTGQICQTGNCVCPNNGIICNNACANTQYDPQNCGVCGRICSGGTPNCSAGQCVAGVTYSESFVQNTTYPVTSQQCVNWNNFRTALGGGYTAVTIRGSQDPVGVTCTGAQANQLCQALHNGVTLSNINCNGRMWATGNCGSGMEITSSTSSGTVCRCETPGYAVRPCIASTENWGGINTATCTAPNQTLTVLCQ